MRTFRIYSLSNFQVCNTVLLTMVTMLYIYITCAWLTDFVTGNLYLFTTFIHFSHTSFLSLAKTNLFFVSVRSFLCVIFCFWIPHLNITWYLSDLLNRMSSRSVHVVTNGKISFFFMAEYYHCCFSVVSDSLWPHELQHARPPIPHHLGVCAGSCSLHQCCRPAISSSDALCFFCPQSSPASGTYSVSCLFTSDDQNTGASASASVLPGNI